MQHRIVFAVIKDDQLMIYKPKGMGVMQLPFINVDKTPTLGKEFDSLIEKMQDELTVVLDWQTPFHISDDETIVIVCELKAGPYRKDIDVSWLDADEINKNYLVLESDLIKKQIKDILVKQHSVLRRVLVKDETQQDVLWEDTCSKVCMYKVFHQYIFAQVRLVQNVKGTPSSYLRVFDEQGNQIAQETIW